MLARVSKGAAALLAGTILWLLPHSVSAMEVRLTDGSCRKGTPDCTSDESALRLRCGEADAYIVHGIRWHKIAEIREGFQTWLPDQFAEFRQYLRTQFDDSRSVSKVATSADDATAQLPLRNVLGPTPARPATQADVTLSSEGVPFEKTASISRPLWQPPRRPGPSEATDARVRFLDVDAVGANWDASLDWDGIVLRVWPMDQWGQTVRARGTLEVTLVAGDPLVPESSRAMDQWTRYIRPSDYGNDGAVVRLRFQRQHLTAPIWNSDHAVPIYGEVHVRMAIAGNGVFDSANDLPIRLRRFSPRLDELLKKLGQGSIPIE